MKDPLGQLMDAITVEHFYLNHPELVQAIKDLQARGVTRSQVYNRVKAQTPPGLSRQGIRTLIKHIYDSG